MKTIPAHFYLYFPIESVCCTAFGGILNKLKITGSIGGSIFRRCRQLAVSRDCHFVATASLERLSLCSND